MILGALREYKLYRDGWTLSVSRQVCEDRKLTGFVVTGTVLVFVHCAVAVTLIDQQVR